MVSALGGSNDAQEFDLFASARSLIRDARCKRQRPHELAEGRDATERVALGEDDPPVGDTAQPRGALSDRVEHRLDVGGGAANDAQDLSSRVTSNVGISRASRALAASRSSTPSSH